MNHSVFKYDIMEFKGFVKKKQSVAIEEVDANVL